MQNLKKLEGRERMSASITNPNQGVSKPLLIAPRRTATADLLVVGGGGAAFEQEAPTKKKLAVKKFSGAVKYKECLKNHAAAIGGSATDGCGEFMAGGEEGSLEALKCSACNCHRNFHRKIHMQEAPRAYNGGGVLRIKGVNAAEGKKRFRTKFDQDQKEKMLVFAEKSGWKLQKADDAEVRSLCEEIGVKRKVLKVWMHNNKYQFANKTTTHQS